MGRTHWRLNLDDELDEQNTEKVAGNKITNEYEIQEAQLSLWDALTGGLFGLVISYGISHMHIDAAVSETQLFEIFTFTIILYCANIH